MGINETKMGKINKYVNWNVQVFKYSAEELQKQS